MVRSNEITSTEKLLDVIRRKGSHQEPAIKDPVSNKPAVSPSPRKHFKLIRSGKASSGRPATVGIDIGHEYLHIVKTTRGTDAKPSLIDQKRVPIPSSMTRRSSEFGGFLKTALDNFCGSNKNLHLWAIMSAANVEVHHIRIPRVDKKQIETVVNFNIKKESPVDENISILDYEVLGEATGQGANKYDVMYYTAPRQDVEDLKKLFSNAGWPLTGISITPFAMQNLFRTEWIPGYDGTAASLFIGNDYSRIDIYARGNLIMTRGIKAGMSSVLDLLIENINERNAQSNDGLNQESCDRNKARLIFSSLNPDSSNLTPEGRYGLSEQEIWAMVLPAMERMTRQIERTFEYFTENLGNQRIDKIYVSGVMNVYKPIIDYVGEQLGIQSELFDPLDPAIAGEAIGETMYKGVSERISMAPAVAIALSDNSRTPNLIYTTRDKTHDANVKRINRSIIGVFMVCVVLCTGYVSYELLSLRSKGRQILALDKQLSEYKNVSPVSRDAVAQMVADLKAEAAADKLYLKKYESAIFISEISNLNQPNVRLLNLKANLAVASDKPQEIEIEGIVLGEKRSLHSLLTAYVLKLDSSPLFTQVKILKTNEEIYRRGTVLRFTAAMKVEGV